MRLIILYSSRGIRNHRNWDPATISKSSLAVQYCSDGYSYVGERLIETSAVSEVLAFVETGKYFGHREISKNHKVYAVPYITCVLDMLQPEDVLFIRGGWKHWAEPLSKLCTKHWMIYYGAGTPRGHWAYWHAVFNDFVMKPTISRHPILPFTKPINYNIFYPIKGVKKEYDVLLNSCFHIYDKKGQYKVVDAAIKYKEIYGTNLKIVMPGGLLRNTHTSNIPSIIDANRLDVYRPGIISRENLNILINKCKLYCHMGYGEQNARSALEAMRCGLPLYIASPHLWPSFVNDSDITRICKNPDDVKYIATDIRQILADVDESKFGDSTRHFDTHNSPEMTVQQFTFLLNCMRGEIPNQATLVKKLNL